MFTGPSPGIAREAPPRSARTCSFLDFGDGDWNAGSSNGVEAHFGTVFRYVRGLSRILKELARTN